MENDPMTTTMSRSETFADLAAALVKFQSGVRAVAKGEIAKVQSQKGNYEYSYADLAAIMEGTREARAAAGLAVTQFPCGDERRVVLVTMLLHTSGQWMSSEMSWATDSRPQSIGSCLTYMRRYAYCAILGIATEDDDGAAAQQGTPSRSAPRQAQRPPASQPASAARPPATNGAAAAPAPTSVARATAAQLNEILARMKRLGWSVPHQRNWLKKHADVELPSELTAGAATHVIGELEAAASAGQQAAE